MERLGSKRNSCLSGDAATNAVCQYSGADREGRQVALERGRGGREGGERVVPAAVLVQVEVVLVGKQRSGEAVAAALPPLKSTPLFCFLSLTAEG